MANLGKSLSKILSPRQYTTLSVSPNKSVSPTPPSYFEIKKKITNIPKENVHPERQLNKNDLRKSAVNKVSSTRRALTKQLQVPNCNIPLINSPVMKELEKKGVDGIATQNILGRGRFGTVIKGLYRDIPIAVKIIAKDNPNSEIIHKEENAVQLVHPNIIRVLKTVSSEENYDIILMEYCNGANLLKKINDATFIFDIQRCIRYALDVGYALQHCHKNKIIHLDVKPENIVIDLEDHCKLCDFGSSRIMDIEDGVETPWPGTPSFAAPEVLQGFCVTCKADIYSFGILLWQMLSRETPYFGEDIHSVIYKVVTQIHRPRRIQATAEVEMAYINLYKKCWESNHQERPSIDEVITFLLDIGRMMN